LEQQLQAINLLPYETVGRNFEWIRDQERVGGNLFFVAKTIPKIVLL
jgi:hypothetical protein